MKPDSRLAKKIEGKDFIITAEYLPSSGTAASAIEASLGFLRDGPVAVNVADNHYGVAVSSFAASVGLGRYGIEPVYQVVTRDRNRIALQSDLLGAAFLGIKNVLCLSGYHQALVGCPDSANVFDIDSIQLIAAVRKMNDEGLLLDGSKIDGPFSMLIGAAANPSLRPLELNVIRIKKKVKAGADFIQTQAVFDMEAFKQWLDALKSAGITDRVAILAGVMPLTGAAEAKKLNETFTDFTIPSSVIDRLEKAGSEEAQKKEGIAICVEIIKQMKSMPGLRGVHILSGGNEAVVPQIISAAA
ncbi:MAG: methylenetetrahydrofolate reductase [Dehalococcoidia bacterium]|nr:MAG: methylenetetrahydrofolate reductase [Dehalococcoidia bacterium]